MAIGFSVTVGVFLGGPVSGGADNPASALGPMIVTGLYPVWFSAGSLAGAVVAALLYKFIGSRSAPTALNRLIYDGCFAPSERFTKR